ncbi:hypothetical protein CTI12_AA420800 [Artemisia annua]|uniref:AP-5 complex subunit zeta-1 n=1 Tax=Artemisia annua TaxID=35608 RepID=A0A2U1LHN8_ARTAN|nr:hypothetical protein CTI12_AA420800 [Artemisia annua]
MDWEIHLRTLSSSARDSNFSNDPSSDASLLHSVRKLIELCKNEDSDNLIARVYPQLNKIFQRSVSQSKAAPSGLLLLAILQFFIDYGEFVLHDADPSLRTFFRSCLSREFADPVVAEATLDFLNVNKKKILLTFPTLLPQFYPLMLKLIAWNGEKLEKRFLRVFPGLMSPGSFLPLFISLVDLPVLIVALEKVEKSSGPLIGSSIASIQKSAAPEMLLALMDEAYTGSTIGDGGADSESEDSNSITSDPLFLELLKDENDGLAAILQFFIDYGEFVLHDADPSLRTFFRSCLSREFADPVVAEATLDFLNVNKKKILLAFPTLLPQFYPLMLKLIAWNGEKLEKRFLRVFPGLMSPGSFLPLFISLVDLPVLIVALEKVEKSSGPLIGSSIASIQKSAAPEMLLALMDEAYTGSTIGDGGADSESEDSNSITSDPLFLELLKDENDGLAQRHWTSPGMEAALQAAISSPSDRLKQALKLAPRLLDVYFSIALHDVNQSLKCALIPMLLDRYSKLFPDKIFTYEVRKRLLNFILAAFHQSPEFVAILKKPIVDRLGEAYDSPEKTELALQLCWAIGEHGGGGVSHKDAARELFESLELLLYENLSSSRLGVGDSVLGSSSTTVRRSSQSRLLCFVVTAIAKIATHHRELLPRARVSLGKVSTAVWTIP